MSNSPFHYIQYSACSDAGLCRPTNEDAYACLEEDGCFLVSDGMGGGSAGEIASQIVEDMITESIAGSAADLYQCMRRAVSFGIPREQAVWAATALPARVIGRESETGATVDGRAADFVICGGELEPEAVYLGGKRLEQSVGPFASSR